MPINSNIPQCQYIRTDGRRCGSPALKTKRWCYFHYEVNRKTVTLDIPPLEDGNAVQLALTDLARAVADGRIQLKPAALLAYILQTASANLKKVQLGVFPDSMVRDLPDLDPYSRGLSIQDPSAVEGQGSVDQGFSPDSRSDPAETAGAPAPTALPKARGSEGHGFSARSERSRTGAETAGAPAPTTLPKARVSEGHGFSRAEKAGPMNPSALPKAGAQPPGAAPRKVPSASIRAQEVVRKTAAAKSGSLKDANDLLNLLKDVG